MTTRKPRADAPKAALPAASPAASAFVRSATAASRKDPLAWIARWYGPVAWTAVHK